MKNLRKLLPGGKRDPKLIVVFANRQQDCDRIILYLIRTITTSRVANYPIHAYCLEKPYEAHRCAKVTVDPDPSRLYHQAQRDLADAWVALSAVSWNGVRVGALVKIIPFTLPPFRGIVGNENGDFFPLRPLPVLRHLFDRFRQWFVNASAQVAHWINVHVYWPGRHIRTWFRLKVRDKILWTTAVALGRMAWFAQRVGPLTRSAYNRLPSGSPQELEPPPPAKQFGITRIEYQGRDWHKDEIAELLRESESRFILFCPPGYTESFEDFLPLFQDRKTFAVTRQTGYREWRPIVFAMSPFRQLQPREATRVAAPLALTVLVDREKLAAMKLPETLVFGAAWLNLFWRAGAAGWHSYSIGPRSPVPQQQEGWLEEMLFVKQLYLEPALQRLRNIAPALCRGNIAFRPDLTQPYRVFPRVLVVAPYLPFPLSHGGAVRIYNLCKAMADRIDFVLICFREMNERVDYEELHKIFRQVYVVDRDEIHNDPDMPKQVNHYQSTSMRALISEVVKREKIDLLQIEYTDLAGYREAAPNIPAILVEHDLTYTLHRQFAERDKTEAVQLEYQRWLKFETERLRTFKSVFVMSEQDYTEARSAGANALRTFVVPNGVDLTRFSPLPVPQGETEIFYVGSFRHLPNFLGFEELRTKIMPLVWEKHPHARLRVIGGPDHETHWRTALKGASIPHLDPRIVIHGFVADLAPLYASAHIVAVPLPLSAGTNIKVMEALACRRAIVTTPVGAQGLDLADGADALISPLGEEFAAAICRLIANPTLRDTIAGDGRKTAEERFGWEAISRRATDAYSLLIRESRAKSPSGDGSDRENDKEENNDHENDGSERRRVLNEV
jgi:glycosyltransferase involved in cell wall biosynthesis